METRRPEAQQRGSALLERSTLWPPPWPASVECEQVSGPTSLQHGPEQPGLGLQPSWLGAMSSAAGREGRPASLRTSGRRARGLGACSLRGGWAEATVSPLSSSSLGLCSAQAVLGTSWQVGGWEPSSRQSTGRVGRCQAQVVEEVLEGGIALRLWCGDLLRLRCSDGSRRCPRAALGGASMPRHRLRSSCAHRVPAAVLGASSSGWQDAVDVFKAFQAGC